MDVRDKTENWAFKEYKDKYSAAGVVTINKDRDALRDFAIGMRLFYFHPQGNPDFASTAYQNSAVATPNFGWGAPFGNEGSDVEFGAKNGLFTVASDWTLNLSVLYSTGHLIKKPLEQKIRKGKSATKYKKDMHYVTFIMSDGDNLNWILDGCHRDEKYFANRHRGSFPIGWKIPPLAADLAPIVMDWYYQNATQNDVFLCGVSGAGYTIPSSFSDMEAFAKLTHKYMKLTDTKALCIIDEAKNFENDARDSLKKFIKENKDLEGIFYFAGNYYAGWQGDIYFVDEVPVVFIRYALWKGSSTSGPEQLIKELNSMQGDNFSAVVVHVWSYGLNEVKQVIDKLNSNVAVVNPEEFLLLIKEKQKK